MESEYVQCPYNDNHKILRFRLPAHLLKCKKSYQGEPLQACVFNATHLVKPNEMPLHLENCRDYHRTRTEQYEKFYEN